MKRVGNEITVSSKYWYTHFIPIFISIGNEMAQQIPKVTCGEKPPCMRVPSEPFEFKSVDEEETIIKSITSLRDNSGQGWD